MERDEIDFGTLKCPYCSKLFIPTLFRYAQHLGCHGGRRDFFVGHGVGSDGIAAVNIYVPLLMLFRGGADDRHRLFGRRLHSSVAGEGQGGPPERHTQAMIVVTALTLLLSAADRGFPDRTAACSVRPTGCCRW